MGVFHLSQMVTPGGVVLGDETLQARLQLLVETSSLTIGLWMVAGRQTAHGAKKLKKLLPERGDKPRTSVRHPWILKIWSVMVMADGNFSRGMKCAIFEKRSTTVKIVVLPLEGGSPVTKSIDMRDHGR